jgi:hypothetical protein
MLASPMKTGCPEPFFCGGGNEASVARVIVYMSMREALTEGIGDKGRDRSGGVRGNG